MKTFRKSLLTSLLPIVAFATTSCAGFKEISFNQAIEYARNNFDDHSLDNVTGDITANINSIAVGANFDVIDSDSGIKHKYDASVGVKGIEVFLPNMTGFALNSLIVTGVSNYYNNFASMFAAMSDINPIDLKYYLNNGGLTFDVTTSKAGKKFINTFLALNAAMNADHYAIQKILQIPDRNGGDDPSNYRPDYDTWSMYVTKCIDNLVGLGGLNPTDSPIFKLVIVLTSLIFDTLSDTNTGIYQLFNVSLDSSSTSINDEFILSATTSSKGFLKNARFTFKTDLSLAGILTPIKKASISTLVVSGSLSINIDLSVKSNLK